jgi:hypothetical protein
MSKERVRPFSNGSQFGDWCASNCERCTKATAEQEPHELCEIAKALGEAYWDDGSVSKEIGDRMGYKDESPPAYVWQCGEVVWTEEWKAQYRRRHEPSPLLDLIEGRGDGG